MNDVQFQHALSKFQPPTKHVHSCTHIQPLQDWHLAIGVLLLVLIDLAILILYNIVEGIQRDLTATKISNRENPMDVNEVH